jgi:hypothetical protein
VEVALRDEEAFALVRELEEGGLLTPIGLDLSKRPDLDYDALEALAAFFGRVQEISKWALYDTLLAIEMRHSDLVAQAVEVTGRQPSTIENGMSIARRIPRSRRRNGIPFHTHGEVASLAPSDQQRWLKTAAVERLTKDELRARVQAEKNGTPDVLPPESKVCSECGRPI